MSLDALPGDWDLYVSLNIEMAMDFLFCDAKSYSETIECSVCRQHVKWVLPFRSLECDLVVKFPAARLCNLYIALLLIT